MSTTFFNKSKEIANEFLQSIVFLDDKAFQSDSSQHAFDAFEVSKAFADEKKVCGMYKPTTKSDIYNFIEIAKKSDVVILDWLIKIPEADAQDSNADEDEDDPRGKYTMPIIDELIKQQGLKLIIIYTGEDILDEITVKIFESVKKTLPNKGECEISSDSIKLLVRYKSNDIENDKQKFNSRTHLLDKIVSYQDLPNSVLTEFTKMTEGFLSNFALLSLSTIRNNSHKILRLFSKELDAAYFGHKVILPIQSDSEELLLKLFGDSISDLLHYTSISLKIRNELIDTWIESNISNEQFTVNYKNFQRNRTFLTQLIHSEKENVAERFDDVFSESTLSKSDKKLYCESKSTELFLNLAHQNKKDKINSEFAKLTHHKSLFLPQKTAPRLTLGTVIRSLTNHDSFYVCIQQRCDSVRLKRDEERKFLFLPLTKTGSDKFHIITPNGDKLKLDKKSYSIRTIKFKCNCDEGEIKGTLSENGIFIFKEIYEQGDVFEWILDLKDLHSQRIVINYVSLLARIGLDESEWLRMAGN
jgi:hypothetical protein